MGDEQVNDAGFVKENKYKLGCGKLYPFDLVSPGFPAISSTYN